MRKSFLCGLAAFSFGLLALPAQADTPQSDMSFPPPAAIGRALATDIPGPAVGVATIDVAVVTSPEFDQALANSGGPLSRINALIGKANKAFKDSGVMIALRLVGTGSWAGNNAASNADTLELITPAKSPNTAASAYFGNLRATRLADIVVYLRRYAPAHKNCGQAWIGAYRQSYNDPLLDISASADFGYAVVSDDQGQSCADLTFAHEIGHNLGSKHDRETANYDPSPEGRGAFDESFGFRVVAGTRTFHTIMGYPAPSNPAEAGVFSSPLLKTPCGGLACGVASGPASADNVRRFNDVRIKVASWAGSRWFDLSVSRDGTGEGTVTGSGLDCGTTCTLGESGGTSITLTARPDEGSQFAGWSGDCSGSTPTCVVSLAAARLVTARFTSPNPRFSLKIARTGSGSGTITGPDLNCASACAVRYAAGSMIVLRATGDPGSEFAGWEGACAGQPAACRITINEPVAATARFRGRATTMVSSGSLTSYAVRSDGSLWGWGNNDYGQLGVGHTVSSPKPVLIGSDYVSVEAGDNFAFGIKKDGSLWTWGDNSRGQLGDGTTTSRLSPVRIGDNFLTVSAGAYHAVGIKSGGTLWTWGWNLYGQIGNGGQQTQLRPIQVGTGYSHATAGGADTMAVRQDGSLWVWGFNESGQLGDGSFTHRLSPVQIGSGFRQVFAGGDLSFAIKQNGELWGWGLNQNGQVGNGTLYTQTKPVRIGDGFAFATARGFISAAGRKADGSLWTWGQNGDGALGNGGGVEYQLTPAKIGNGFTLLAGRSSFLATRGDGSLWGWGKNQSGELGDGTQVSRIDPVLVFGVE